VRWLRTGSGSSISSIHFWSVHRRDDIWCRKVVSIQANFDWSYVLPSTLTARIRAALALHPDPAYSAADVLIRSTRAGGAMALLCAGVNFDRIRLLGRWRSDKMYRYLHVQAQHVMTGCAAAHSCCPPLNPPPPLAPGSARTAIPINYFYFYSTSHRALPVVRGRPYSSSSRWGDESADLPRITLL
jgi:hypothetical protein